MFKKREVKIDPHNLPSSISQLLLQCNHSQCWQNLRHSMKFQENTLAFKKTFYAKS
jgi:hypothetical protein